ncbi:MULTISPECIES: hypothetical protein [Actinomyces]|uniref:Uncharacterized protein n=1 Tax=Actinomyces marmotae TaxID=2737173 RepID=A0A6M8B7M8_9ACTO|nr:MULTISPECIES: hypothetical protein [Actinomyces]QKD79441.1 hypothetical protein HPC72_03510 [Actinomyces marmotae]
MAAISNPLDSLLKAENDRESAARRLAAAHEELAGAIEAYREAWTAATRAGWAVTSLKSARFVDPARLPRPTATGRASTTTQE